MTVKELKDFIKKSKWNDADTLYVADKFGNVFYLDYPVLLDKEKEEYSRFFELK